jgi:hypothetical protein
MLLAVHLLNLLFLLCCAHILAVSSHIGIEPGCLRMIQLLPIKVLLGLMHVLLLLLFWVDLLGNYELRLDVILVSDYLSLAIGSRALRRLTVLVCTIVDRLLLEINRQLLSLLNK